jgi:hypothetical protein
VKKKSFGLLELETVDLEHFWRKTPLGPLGVNNCINNYALYDEWIDSFFEGI